MSFGRLIKDIKKQENLIVTPRLSDFLVKSGGHLVLNEAEARLLSKIVTDDGNNVRHSRFGASSRGQCHRRQIFAYLGMPQRQKVDPILNNIFLDGTWRHLRWQMVGKRAGIFTHVEVSAKVPKMRLSVSIDALNADERWLFELKGARMIPSEPPENHILQIHTYFLATGYERCSYVAEDKASQDWREWVIERDPETMQRVKKELRDLNESIRERRLPVILPACYQEEGPWRNCPYRHQCIHQGDQWPDAGHWLYDDEEPDEDAGE